MGEPKFMMFSPGDRSRSASTATVTSEIRDSDRADASEQRQRLDEPAFSVSSDCDEADFEFQSNLASQEAPEPTSG